jgi:tight adherence protein B
VAHVRALLAAICGAAVGVGVLLTAAGLRGRRVLPSLGDRGEQLRAVAESRRVWLSLAAGLAAWVVTGWIAVGVVVMLAIAAVPRLFGEAERRAQIERAEAIASWAEMLRDAMAAADGVEEAIEATVPIAPEPIRHAVGLLDAARRSQPLTDALRVFGSEVDHPAADLVVAALVIAAQGEGTDFGRVLDRLAAITRDEVRMRQRIEASRARLRTSSRMMLMILVVVAAAIAALSRDYLEPYGTPLGQMVLVTVAAMFAAGAVLLDRMSRIEPPQRFMPRQRMAVR